MSQSSALARTAEAPRSTSPVYSSGRKSKSPKRTIITPLDTHERTRRIEIMLEEQVTLVKGMQSSLHKTLYELENTADQDSDKPKKQIQFQDMLTRSQELVVIVEVMLKIKNELAHARLDLERAKKSKQGVDPARKRLRWLEQRLEKLLLATRSQSRHLLKPLSNLVSSAGDIHSGLRTFLTSRSEEFFPKPSAVLSPGEISLHRSIDKELSEIIQNKSAESLVRNESSASKEQISTDEGRQEVSSPDQSRILPSLSEKDKLSRETISASSSKIIADSPSTESSPEPQSEHEDTAGHETDEEPQIKSRTSSSKLKTVSIVEQENIHKYADEEDDNDDNDEDEKDYWGSDHHKFEWSKSYILELDPLSWHALGIPVCESFLPKGRPRFASELPWKEKPMTVNNVLDIHKLALDKLLVRLHKIYDNINKCTQATIDPTPSDEKLETLMGNLELDVSPSEIITRKGSKDLSGSDFAQYDSSLPAISGIPRWRSATPSTRYKLMKVPSMSKIITKNPDKLYPRHSSNWSEDQPDDFQLERIVKTTSKPAKSLRPLQVRPKIQVKRISSKQSTMKDINSHWKKGGFLKVVKANKTLIALGSGGKSGKLDPNGPKWRRIEELLSEEYLLSSNSETAKESAKSLGQLKCSETTVLTALSEVVKTNPDPLVRYEASKSLILLGSWDEVALKVFVDVLKEGSDDHVKELLLAVAQAKHIQFVIKSSDVFKEMSRILCALLECDDFCLSFQAAVCLGKLLIADPRAKNFLTDNLQQMTSAQKAEALDVLVKKMNCQSDKIVGCLLDQLSTSTNWKHRVQAADLLISIGKDIVLLYEPDRVFEVMERLLWDHSSKELRSKVAESITALGLRQKACNLVYKKLEDSDETVRAHAIISLATLQMKTEKEMKILLDILELDSSGYVRIQVVRAFSQMEWVDPRIIRSLKERARSEGVLGREAKRALQCLHVPCEA